VQLQLETSPCAPQRNGSWQGASFNFINRFPAFSFSLIHGARAFTAVLINLDNGFTKQCASANVMRLAKPV
jgi:hypothetical protein